MGKDYYQILHLPRSATTEDIREAYLRLAKEWHPDTKKSKKEKDYAKNKFQDISEAFEVLSHPHRKEIYDKHGEDGLTAGGKRTATGPIPQHKGRGLPPGSGKRLASQFFGRGIPGLDPMTGRPMKTPIDPEQGVPGITLGKYPGVNPFRRENLPEDVDPTPSVSKTVNGNTTITCPIKGTFVKPKQPEQKKLPILAAIECTLEELFKGCQKDVGWTSYQDGEHVKKTRTVDILPGWMVGQKVEFSEDEDDIMAIVIEKEHPIFKRKKNDLFCNVDITLRQALCSGEIVIPTIKQGKTLKLKLAKTIEEGYEHKIKGHGMLIVDTKDRGDLYVTFHVKMPKNLTAEQREAFAEVLPVED